MSLLIKLILLPNIKIRILLKGMNRQPRRGVKHNFIHQTPTKKNPSEKNHHSTTINPNRFTAKTPSQIININNNNSNHINNYPHLKPYKQNRTPQQPHRKNTSIEPNNKHESDSKGQDFLFFLLNCLDLGFLVFFYLKISNKKRKRKRKRSEQGKESRFKTKREKGHSGGGAATQVGRPPRWNLGEEELVGDFNRSSSSFQRERRDGKKREKEKRKMRESDGRWVSISLPVPMRVSLHYYCAPSRSCSSDSIQQPAMLDPRSNQELWIRSTSPINPQWPFYILGLVPTQFHLFCFLHSLILLLAPLPCIFIHFYLLLHAYLIYLAFLFISCFLGYILLLFFCHLFLLHSKQNVFRSIVKYK